MPIMKLLVAHDDDAAAGFAPGASYRGTYVDRLLAHVVRGGIPSPVSMLQRGAGPSALVTNERGLNMGKALNENEAEFQTHA